MNPWPLTAPPAIASCGLPSAHMAIGEHEHNDETAKLLRLATDALESVGEVGRALAICMELHAEAGEYRDVAARVDRLAKEQTRR